jgi:hypothetical protein
MRKSCHNGRTKANLVQFHRYIQTIRFAGRIILLKTQQQSRLTRNTRNSVRKNPIRVWTSTISKGRSFKMAYAVTETNGVKVYNLSAGKSLPQFLSASKRKELRRSDEGYRRRIQLLQDFGFDTACQRVKFGRDGIHLAATGTYPPCLKMFDVRELSMKFERRLEAEVVQFQVTIVFATTELHARPKPTLCPNVCPPSFCQMISESLYCWKTTGTLSSTPAMVLITRPESLGSVATWLFTILLPVRSRKSSLSSEYCAIYLVFW